IEAALAQANGAVGHQAVHARHELRLGGGKALDELLAYRQGLRVRLALGQQVAQLLERSGIELAAVVGASELRVIFELAFLELVRDVVDLVDLERPAGGARSLRPLCRQNHRVSSDGEINVLGLGTGGTLPVAEVPAISGAVRVGRRLAGLEAAA